MSTPSVRIPGRATLPAAFAAVLAAAGCIGEMNIGATRLDAGYVMWPSAALMHNDEGTSAGFEISRGTDEDPAFGPIYFAFAYSYAAMPNEVPGMHDTYEHRAGTRWRSSMLDHNSSSYPYAALGVYGAWLERGEDSGRRMGFGIEGGYGVRIGMGERAALDLDILYSFGYFEGVGEAYSTRLGAGFAVRY